MSLKLSQISGGGALAPATDQLVAVRSGATDVLVTPGTVTSMNASNPSGTVVASVSGAITLNHVAQFADAAGTVKDGGVLGTAAAATASSNTGTVAAVNGGTTATHIAVFSDSAGTIHDTALTSASFDAAGAAATAQSNAEAFAANASNLSSGTVAAGLLPLATTGAFGVVKPDGTTVTISGGVISASGGGGGPAYVAGSGTATASGSNSFAAGSGATATGGEDIAIGFNAGTVGGGTSAGGNTFLGPSTNTDGATGVTNTTLIGGATAGSNGLTAAVGIGSSVIAAGDHVVAIGDGMTTTVNDQIQIGNPTNIIGTDASGNLQVKANAATTGSASPVFTNAPTSANVQWIPFNYNGVLGYVPFVHA